jgi:hypothetical protein
MALETEITGALSGTGADVDANRQLKVALPQDETKAGYAIMTTTVDEGTVLPEATRRAPEVTAAYRLRVGIDQPMFQLSFEGTNIARDRIQQNDTTATSAQASGFLTVNSGASTTSGQGSNIRTYRTFPLFGGYSAFGDMWVRSVNNNATNAVSEWGFGYVSGVTAQATDGLFFRVLSGGNLRAVMVFNSTDTNFADITTTNIPTRDGTGTFDITEVNHYIIDVDADTVQFWINDTLVAKLKPTSTQGGVTSTMSLPLFARVYNSGTASPARQIGLGFLGCGAYQIQPGTASGPTMTRGAAGTGWPTSGTAQTAPTYTATTAPATNSLGGYFITAAVSAMTTDADYPVFSYANPAGSATLPGKTLYITSVRVGELIATAAASTNTVITMWAVGIGSTSTATTATEGAAVVAARLIPVGQVFWSASTAIGETRGGWTLDFGAAPLVCPPGTHVQLIMRPTGTVTSNTLQLRGLAAFIGYYE